MACDEERMSTYDVSLGMVSRIPDQRGEPGVFRGSRGGAQAGRGGFGGCWHRERRAQAANRSALRARQAESRAGDAQHGQKEGASDVENAFYLGGGLQVVCRAAPFTVTSAWRVVSGCERAV